MMPPKKTVTSKPMNQGMKRDAKPKAAKTVPASKINPTGKGSSKTNFKKPKPKPTPENVAAIKIQHMVRGFLAKSKLEKIKKEKQEYEDLIGKLQKEAWLEMIHRQREEEEKQRAKEDAERKRKAQEKKWIKTFLEAAFDGELDNMKKILNDIEKNIQNTSQLTSDNLQKYIKRAKTKMIDCEDANGNSALSEASAGGNVETIEFLIQNGANINALGSFHRTPLYRAAFGGHLDAVKHLLEEGGDPRIFDNDGVTAEQIAAFPEISNYLQEWDVSKTESLLAKIAERDEEIKVEELKHKKKEQEKLEKNLKDLESEYTSKQKLLKKAHEELNKRIFEHDKAVGEGFERTDVTLQCIHDAELFLARAQREEEEMRKQLHEARLHLREQKPEDTPEDKRVKKCNIKELDQVLILDVGNVLKNSEKWPLIIDTSNQGVTFLRYRDTNYINLLNPKDANEEVLRAALLGSIRYGKFLVVDMMEVDMLNVLEDKCNAIQENLFQLLLSKELMKDSKYLSLIRSTDGKEYEKQNFIEDRVSRFQLVVVSKMYEPPDHWLDQFHPIKIITPSMD